MSDKINVARWKPGDRLTRAEAAEYLSMGTSRLAQLRRQEEIKHHKNPHTKRVYYLFEDVDDLARRRASADAPDTDDE